MEFLISQICGIAASMAAIISMQIKSIKGVLAWNLTCNLMSGLSYVLVGGFSGCIICLAAISQAVVYSVYRLKNKKSPMFLMWIFAVLYVLCSLPTFKGAVDIISIVAGLTAAFGLAQEKSSNYRVFMVLNGVLWSIYDVSVGAYTMILSHAVTAISATIGIIRLDLKKQNRS